MLGWSFSVRRDAASDETPLARWTTGPWGTQWLNALVRTGDATMTDNVGYPNTYRLAARHVQAALANGVPAGSGPPVIGDDYELPEGWVGEPRIDHASLNAIDPGELLRVDAWDQS